MASNILDLLRNEGVLSSGLQEKLLNLVPDNAKEKLSSIIQRYQELNKEEKEELANEIVEKFTHSFRDKVQSSPSLYTQLFYSHSYMLFIFAVLFIVIILVFFVYKLFKCSSERETKREEKKRNKQMKKKK